MAARLPKELILQKHCGNGCWATLALNMNHKSCKTDQLCLLSASIDIFVQPGRHCVFSPFKSLDTCFQLSSSQTLPPFHDPSSPLYLAHRRDIHTANMPTMWKIASDVVFLFLRLRSCIAVEAPRALMVRVQHCSLSVESVDPNGATGLIKMYGPGPAQHARMRWSLKLLNNYYFNNDEKSQREFFQDH